MAEQHRIVIRVKKLLEICDRLEEQLAAGQAESRHLLESVLSQALNDNVAKSDGREKSHEEGKRLFAQ